MRKPSSISDLHRRVGGLEARVDSLEGSTDSNTERITTLEITTTKVLTELEKSSSTLDRIEKSLAIVEQITDVKDALTLVGSMVAKLVKGLKYLMMSGVLLYAAYSVFKTGDIASAVEYIREFFNLGMQ